MKVISFISIVSLLMYGCNPTPVRDTRVVETGSEQIQPDQAGNQTSGHTGSGQWTNPTPGLLPAEFLHCQNFFDFSGQQKQTVFGSINICFSQQDHTKFIFNFQQINPSEVICFVPTFKNQQGQLQRNGDPACVPKVSNIEGAILPTIKPMLFNSLLIISKKDGLGAFEAIMTCLNTSHPEPCGHMKQNFDQHYLLYEF